jgi:catechol 2,3-dioxygenase
MAPIPQAHWKRRPPPAIFPAEERIAAMSATIEAARPARAVTAAAPAGMRIGHVHLKVADLDRALAFWRDIIGLEVQQRMGNQAVFLSVDGYHHHIALNTWESAGGGPPPFGTTGLYHVALLYPDRPALARALKRLVEAGWPLEGASDHGVSEALYLRDPDGNGVELYHDRPREAWPHDQDGNLAMVTRRLDLRALLAEAA